MVTWIDEPDAHVSAAHCEDCIAMYADYPALDVSTVLSNDVGLAILLRNVRAGCHEDRGWGSSNYGFSKACVMAYTKIVAREEGSSMRVNCAEPGNCLTDMNPQFGMVPPEVGARTSVMLALLPDGAPTGEIFKDERSYRW